LPTFLRGTGTSGTGVGVFTAVTARHKLAMAKRESEAIERAMTVQECAVYAGEGSWSTSEWHGLRL